MIPKSSGGGRSSTRLPPHPVLPGVANVAAPARARGGAGGDSGAPGGWVAHTLPREPPWCGGCPAPSPRESVTRPRPHRLGRRHPARPGRAEPLGTGVGDRGGAAQPCERPAAERAAVPREADEATPADPQVDLGLELPLEQDLEE